MDAGFSLIAPDEYQNVTLPCAYDNASADADKELSTIVGQALWKDIWGVFVDNVPGEPKWWWEDEEIMQECLKRKTVFECRTIVACKNG